MTADHNEARRLEALYELGMLDTPAEERFDRVTRLARHVLNQPIALITLLDADRAWFKSCQGLSATEAPRSEAFCDVTVRQAAPLVVEDLSQDPRFKDNPLVTGDLHARFYAGYPLFAPTGEVVGTCCVIGQSTATLSEADQQALADLAAVAQNELTQAELARAVQRAEEANHAKGLFLANMSHELRTPLNAIIGYSEMLKEEMEERRVHDLVPDVLKVHDAGKHLLGLVNDLLDLSKLSVGTLALDPEPFSIAEVVQDAIAAMEPKAAKNHNRLVVEAPEDLGEMTADRVKVRQVIQNLLSNAAKFTESGTISVAAYADARHVTVTVTDTGIGMTEAHLGRLFQPFVQGDDSSTRRYGGTGLGLTLSQRLCHMMGGTITGHSAPGEGSRFMVMLPRTPQTGAEATSSGDRPLALDPRPHPLL